MKYYVKLGDREYGLEIHQTETGTLVRPIDGKGGEAGHETVVDFAPVHANVDTGEGLYSIIADGKSFQLYVEPVDGGFRTMVWRHRLEMQVLTEREWRLQKSAPRQVSHTGELIIKAPMPGLVKNVLVSMGDAVAKGQRMVVLEAMKMENDISSPREGRVKAVHVEPGTVVEGGKPLVSIES